MSRKTPVAEWDLKIAERLSALRRQRRFSRGELAARAGVSVGIISRVELGRMPLRYEDGRNLLRGLSAGSESRLGLVLMPLNPLWLAEGRKPMNLPWAFLLPSVHDLRLDPALTFSFVVAKYRDLIEQLLQPAEMAELPEAWLASYLDHWDVLSVRSTVLAQDAATVQQLFERSAAKLVPNSTKAAALMQYYREILSEPIMTRSGPAPRKQLTDFNESVKSRFVKYGIADLLARLNQATARHGRKSELAQFLGVPPASVSQWLSGERKPGGERTLQLLHWVEQQEGTGQKPRHASTQRGHKAQDRTPCYESSKTKPKKS